jgi:hypothetical protein
MGSFEEEGELQARARARRAVRSLHVHVPTARAWRLQVGQGADPGVRHLRRVQAPATILTPTTSGPWPLSRNSILELPPTSQSSSTAPRIRRSAEPLQFLGPIIPRPNQSSPAVRGARPVGCQNSVTGCKSVIFRDVDRVLTPHTPGRPVREDGQAQGLPRARHLRRGSAPGRHEGERDDHRGQHRS